MTYLRRIGVTEMIVATTERVIGEDHRAQYRSWATPAGGLTLLRHVFEAKLLSDTSQALLMRFLVETTTGPRRLRGDLPAGTLVAHKTGSSGTENGVCRRNERHRDHHAPGWTSSRGGGVSHRLARRRRGTRPKHRPSRARRVGDLGRDDGATDGVALAFSLGATDAISRI